MITVTRRLSLIDNHGCSRQRQRYKKISILPCFRLEQNRERIMLILVANANAFATS